MLITRTDFPKSVNSSIDSIYQHTLGYGKWDIYDLRTGETHSVISNPFGGTLSMALSEARRHAERLGRPIEIYIKQNDEWKWIDKVYPSALASIGYYKNGSNKRSNDIPPSVSPENRSTQPGAPSTARELIHLPPGYCPVCGCELEHIKIGGMLIMESYPNCDYHFL
jgi:hypothetical protein